MSYHYIQQEREQDSHALPDVEVWETEIVTLDCPSCGLLEVPFETDVCPSCERDNAKVVDEAKSRTGWFYAFGPPGCLHDSDPVGPFETEAEALAEARDSCLQ